MAGLARRIEDPRPLVVEEVREERTPPILWFALGAALAGLAFAIAAVLT